MVLLEVLLVSRLPPFRAESSASESRCTSFRSSILSRWRVCSFCFNTAKVSYGNSSSRGSRLRCLFPGGEESSQGRAFRSGVSHPGTDARTAEALGPLEAREASRSTTAGILPGASLRLSAKGRLWSGRIATPNWVRTSLTWRIKPSPFGRVSRASRTAKPSRPTSVRRATALCVRPELVAGVGEVVEEEVEVEVLRRGALQDHASSCRPQGVGRKGT